MKKHSTVYVPVSVEDELPEDGEAVNLICKKMNKPDDCGYEAYGY